VRFTHPTKISLGFSRMRFSVKRLIVVVSALAVTCYCLVYPNPLIADAYYTLCLAGIVLGFVTSIAVQGERRIFWFAFALVVTAYTWMTLYGRSDGTMYAAMKEARMETYSRASLITSRLLSRSYAYIAASPAGRFRDAMDYTRFMTFMAIGHASLALLFGWATGAWASVLYRKRTQRSSAP